MRRWVPRGARRVWMLRVTNVLKMSFCLIKNNNQEMRWSFPNLTPYVICKATPNWMKHDLPTSRLIRLQHKKSTEDFHLWLTGARPQLSFIRTLPSRLAWRLLPDELWKFQSLYGSADAAAHHLAIRRNPTSGCPSSFWYRLCEISGIPVE